MRDKIIDWQKAFTYINNHPEVREIILSGGDPLILGADELIKIIEQLAEIPHIRRLRIHSRVPIVMPERQIPNLTQTRLPIVLVVHCNHPNEIDTSVEVVIEALRKTGVFVFNQTVLLRGINDNAQTLISLSEKLFDMGILPYYLHMLDKVKGAAHFCVDEKQAKRLHLEIQAKLPGYLVPKLVVDGKQYKKILA
jgi:KamA family protein